MKSFREFVCNDNYILEGGNVIIGDEEAQRIDLNQLSRIDSVKEIDQTLGEINSLCNKMMGVPLWNASLFSSKKFLSGSSYHFFQTRSIPDQEFVDVKSTVGDIDTQVDVNMKPIIEKFLNSITGKTIGGAKFIGFKSSGEQFITLWKFDKLKISIQIDLEFVEFDKKGFPTDWSQFSHSSAWEDLKKGLKGVAHKYLMGALDAPKFIDMIVKAKTERGKDKKLNRGTHSFSVSHGIRKKMAPVTDDDGNVLYFDGLPAYKELSTKQSFGNTDLIFIFNHFFGVEPTAAELAQMGSFVGTIELIKKHFKRNDWVKICDAFIRKVWGRGAQGLYRGSPQLDLDEKTKMVRYIVNELGIDENRYDSDKIEYYKNYK